jgi:2,3-bisphosphoglycerate-independent phosphoglycerate mutase
MMAAEITTAAIDDIDHRHHDFVVMNYANADMVGHTGVWDATISALETLDISLARLEKTVLERDGILIITADHGNAEEKIDGDGKPLTAHTTSPVPLVFISRKPLGKLSDGGKLGDIAPTVLPLLGLTVPPEMTGNNLLEPAD